MSTGARVLDEVMESVLAAARVLVALSAQSVAESSDTVTLPQLRVLVSRLDHHTGTGAITHSAPPPPVARAGGSGCPALCVRLARRATRRADSITA